MTTQESFTLRITEHIILAYYASSLKILKKYEISTSKWSTVWTDTSSQRSRSTWNLWPNCKILACWGP